MQTFFVRGLSIASLSLLGACGPLSPRQSEQHFNVEVPTEEIDPADVQQLIAGLSVFVQEGSNRIPLADVVEKIEVDGSFQEILQQIVASRDDLADVSCKARNCKVVSLGQELTFKLDGLSVPVLGQPTVNLQKRIELELQLSEDLSRFEACRIEGVRVQTLGWTRVDGLLIRVTDAAIQAFTIDVGLGGDYPSPGCQI